MHFQFVVAPPTTALPAPPSVPPGDGNASLLRELIDVQREQLAYQRAAHEAFGDKLFSDYLVPFEVSSFLLMVAIVGAVAVARGKADPQAPNPQLPKEGAP